MQKQNRAALVLLGINLLTLILLGCVNSVIGQHGVFLYLPSLFFLLQKLRLFFFYNTILRYKFTAKNIHFSNI